ncbi:helix-turn-helix transcriptional regulator [Patulibacter minatonensis]|uniref:helix-turn-helix transcriptional regulator n=1 Tax=Patulibacter minatonensis TaxID=298163 RepID=UPI000478FCDD|nr:LuxR family transcriptional regulator [Patulibacter minatonensis]
MLAREAAAAGLAGRAEESGRLADLGSDEVGTIVQRRLRGLGEQAAAVARAAAVAGERAGPDDLVALSGLGEQETRTAVALLIDAGVLEQGGRSFVHPLVRAAVTATIPRGERARLHGLTAERLRARGARATEVAAHRLLAEPAGDPEAVADLREAAGVAAGEGAVETAVELLRRAVQEPPAADDRADVEIELGELELRAELPDGVPRLRRALEDGPTGDRAARARAALAFVLVHTDPRAALDEAERARAETTDRGLRLRLEALELEALTFVDALDTDRVARMRAGAEDASPSSVMLSYLALESSCAGRTPEETIGLVGRATADGTLDADVGPASSTWNLLTHALRFAEDAEGCRRLLEDGEARMRRDGLRLAGLFVNQSWGYWHRDFGSVATGAARAQLGLDAVRGLGLDVTAPALAAITAENLVLLDRTEDAASTVDVPLGAAEGTYVEPYVLSARALVRAHLRRTADAEADLRRVIAAGDVRGWTSPLTTRGRLRLAELLATHGDRDEARELAEHDVAVARAAGTPGALGAALRVRARTLEGDERVEALRESVDVLAPGPMAMEHGWALLDLGGALRRRGSRSDARDVLRVALDRAAGAESVLLARLVREELEAAGARPRRERLSGVESLTPSERRVAELAAEGLSNREIAETLWVTRKTVEHHLGHAYGKLGISSRTGLPAALGLVATG